MGEKRDSWIEKGRRYRERKTPVRERPRRRPRGGGRIELERRQKWESRTLQGIKSLFVTSTVMKILCFWRKSEIDRQIGRERKRSAEGEGGREGEGRNYLDSPTPRIFGIPIKRLMRLAMRASNCSQRTGPRRTFDLTNIYMCVSACVYICIEDFL